MNNLYPYLRKKAAYTATSIGICIKITRILNGADEGT